MREGARKDARLRYMVCRYTILGFVSMRYICQNAYSMSICRHCERARRVERSGVSAPNNRQQDGWVGSGGTAGSFEQARQSVGQGRRAAPRTLSRRRI